MIRERGCTVQLLAHKDNPQKMLFTRESKAVAMKVGICLGVCNKPLADLFYCTRRPMILHHHNPASAYNKQRAAKPGENGLTWSKMGEMGGNSNVPHILNAQEAETPVMEQQNCEKGPKLGFK